MFYQLLQAAIKYMLHRVGTNITDVHYLDLRKRTDQPHSIYFQSVELAIQHFYLARTHPQNNPYESTKRNEVKPQQKQANPENYPFSQLASETKII